jgi:hypothetical protein
MNVDINGNGARSRRSGAKKEAAIIIEDSEKQRKVILCVWQPAGGGNANFLSKMEKCARAALTLLLK